MRPSYHNRVAVKSVVAGPPSEIVQRVLRMWDNQEDPDKIAKLVTELMKYQPATWFYTKNPEANFATALD